jgi:hypothetical protein
MMFRTCSFEKEVKQTLRDGHWPDGCGAELRAHVDACGNCSDLVLVTQIFQRARSESESTAPVLPVSSPSLLWWRAQLRRRNAATKRVVRPITIAQAFAWCVLGMVGVVFVASQYRNGLQWKSWWAQFAAAPAIHVPPVASGAPDWHVLLLFSGLGALAVLSGVVVYLASDKF